MTTLDVLNALEKVVNPFSNMTLKDQDAIKHVGINDEKGVVILIIGINNLAGDEERYMRKEIAKLIKIDLGFNGVKIQFEQLQHLTCQNAKVILVGGGKGGTGKTTIACNIAHQLNKMGKKVGLIDGDIYGASVLTMLDIPPQNLKINDYGKVIPFNYNDIELVSVEFFNNPSEGLVWKSNVVVNMISNFLYKVSWNKDLEYLIIDMPSDTSEVLSTIHELVPSSEVLLVTTPHLASSHVCIKAGNASKEFNQNIIGVVENMKGFPTADNEESYLNTSGGLVVSQNLGVEFLGSLELNPPKKHLAIYEDDEANASIFKDLATLISIR